MGDMNLKEVVVFLNDVIVFSKILEDHEARLTKVLNRLKEYRLKLSPEKCKFFQSSVLYLGHVVSERGVKTDPEKVAAFKTWPAPRHLKELKAFLGFCGYYRKFIKGYSSIIPYILHTDASSTGLGAALYQEQEGQLHIVAYASRGLSRSESRYPAHKLEFLALKWSVTEKFRDYLYGNQFTVITDSNPLTYILTSAKLDASSYRWLAALSSFSFKLQYHPGKQNGDAEALSRRPHGSLHYDLSQKDRDRIR